MITLAQISDVHVGSPHFKAELMERLLAALAELDPDVVVDTGDMTSDGYIQEYEGAVGYLKRIRQPYLAVPGNHDARNVGYRHFEALIGPREWVYDLGPVRIVGVDSSEPDLNEGRIGREHYTWIAEQFSGDHALKILCLHHHLIAVPGAGRERSTVQDAGDLLELLTDCGCNLVLTGHKHVPNLWRLENMYISNTGTATTLRLRGGTRPCFTIVRFEGDRVRLYRRQPERLDEQLVAAWDMRTGQELQRRAEPVTTSTETDAPPLSQAAPASPLGSSPRGPTGDGHTAPATEKGFAGAHTARLKGADRPAEHRPDHTRPHPSERTGGG